MTMFEFISLYVHQIFSHLYVKLIFSWFMLIAEYAIGWFDLVVKWLLILLILDFTMWFSVAFRDHRLSRTRMMGWLYKMIVYFVGVAMWYWTDIIIFHSTVEFWFKNFIVVYLGINESLSIIRHMATFNVKIPLKLIERLENYRDNLNIWSNQSTPSPSGLTETTGLAYHTGNQNQ